MTVAVPGRVAGPMSQLHTACPSWSVVLATAAPWPSAVLLVPAGVVYSTEHVAPGAVWTVTEAVPAWSATSDGNERDALHALGRRGTTRRLGGRHGRRLRSSRPSVLGGRCAWQREVERVPIGDDHLLGITEAQRGVTHLVVQVVLDTVFVVGTWASVGLGPEIGDVVRAAELQGMK